MNFKFYFLLFGWSTLLIYYVYSLYRLMQNVHEKHISKKFKIFGLLLIIPKEYFNEFGIKYLKKVRMLALVLFLYTIAFATFYFSNR